MRKTLLVAILALVGMQAQAQYCSGGPSSTYDSQIDLFELTGELGTSIDTVLPCSSVGTGLTNLTATDTAVVYRDSSYTISLRAGSCGGTYTNRLTVYVDWNQNQTFEAVELVGYINGLAGGASATQTMTLTVPSGISVGSTRMRVIQQETSSTGPSGPCDSYSWGSMNDYTITVAGPASSCPTPYALIAAGIGADRVNLTWSTTATSTEIAVVEAGVAVTSSDFNSVSGTATTVTGLNGDTEYVGYAYDTCGSDTATFAFRTQCNVFATPFTEDFDGGNFVAATDFYGVNGYMSPCWSTGLTGYSNTYPEWVVGEGVTPSGTSLTSIYSAGPIGDAGTGYGNYMFVEGGNYSYGAARLESPLIDLSSLTEPYLTFDAHMWNSYQSSSYTPKLSIEVSNDNGQTWSKYDVQEGPFASQPTKASPYENVGLPLSAYVNDTVKFAFVLEDFYFYNDLAIDNISIDEAPSCYAPIVTVDSISYDWVTFDALTYLGTSYFYTTSNGTTATSGSLTASPDSVTGLSSDSTYMFYFYSDCSTTYSDTVGPIEITPLTFNACATITTFPYTEGFESNSARKGCWTNEYVVGTQDWDLAATTASSTSSAPGPFEGSMFAEHTESSARPETRLVSPVMDMSAYSTAKVAFAYALRDYYGSSSYTHQLDLEYRLTPTDPWTSVWSATLNNGSSSTNIWQEDEAVILATSSTMQFSFYAQDNWGFKIAIDSVVFDQGPTCVAPMALSAFDVTDNSAMATWTGLTQNYSVSYGVVGSSASLIAATNDTVSISNLTPQTDYYVVVEADCGGGTYSDPSDTLYFTTQCLPDSLGWSEGFENASNPDNLYGPSSSGYDAVPNSCWNVAGTSTSIYNNYSVIYTPTSSYYQQYYPAASGDHFMYGYATTNQGLWIMTPKLHDLGSGANQVRFQYWNFSSTYYGDMYIVAATDQLGFASSNLIYLDTISYGTGTNNWEEFLLEVPTLPAGYEFLYLGKPGGTYSYLRLDDFIYEAQPTCKPATGAEIVNISNSTADLNVFSAAPSDWQVEIVAPFLNSSTNALDFSQGTGAKSVITNSTGSFSGLSSDSQYGVWVRQLCGAGDTSDWRGPYIFKTDCDANATFPYVMEFESDWEAEKACWDTTNTAYSGASRVYKYAYTYYTQSSRNMRFYYYANYGYGEPAQATTQALAIPSTGASIGFKYGSYDSSPAGVTSSFEVLAQETGTGVWNSIGLIEGEDLVTSTSSYDYYNSDGAEIQFMVPASLAGKDVKFKLVYYGESSGPSYFNVDSLFLGTPPACPEPMNLAQTAATASSVTVEWVSPLNQNKGSRVRWGTTAFVQATGAGMIGDTNAVLSPFTITGLSADSIYHVFVQDSCTVTDTTDWLGPFAVRTACNTVNAPYKMPFDGGMDACWSMRGAYDWKSTASSTPSYGAAGFKDHTGNNGAAMWFDASYGSNPNPPVLISRTVDISALSQPELEFFVGSYNLYNNDSNSLVVNIIDANGKTDSAIVYSGSNADWQRVAYDLSSYTSPVTAEFVAYTDPNGSYVPYMDIVVDDISFDEQRNCFAATNAVASNVAANSATVSWDAGSATGTDWIVTVTNSVTGVATSYNATSNSLAISGLSGGSEYCVTVAEICSATGDTTAPTSPVCFTTNCGTVYAPYSQDFASYQYDFNCWTRSTNVSAQGTATLWTGTYGDWMTGGVENVWGNTPGQGTYTSTLYNYAIGVDGSSPFSATPVVNSPMIDVSALFKPQLKFHTISGQLGDTVVTWLGDTVANGQNTLVVDLWDGAAWNDSVYVNNANYVKWDSVLIELNQFNVTGPVQVRFTVNKTAVIPAFDDILVDNFSIEDDPAILTCSDIDSAYAFDMTCGDAMIAWGTVDSNNVFTMGSADTNRIGTVFYVGTDSVDMMAGMKYFTTDSVGFVDGLTPGTDYFFWAMDSCISGNTTSVIGPFSFTTDVAPLPTFPTIASVNDTVTTTSDWTITLTGDSTQTYTWDIGGMTYTGMTVSPSFTSNGTVNVSLTIANDCGSVDSTFTLTVTQIGQEENILANAKIYPNPSNGNFNVEFSSVEGLDYSIQIMDAMGRVISTKEGVTSMNNNVRIDANLPSGVYIVKTIVGTETIVDRVSIRN